MTPFLCGLSHACMCLYLHTEWCVYTQTYILTQADCRSLRFKYCTVKPGMGWPTFLLCNTGQHQSQKYHEWLCCGCCDSNITGCPVFDMFRVWHESRAPSYSSCCFCLPCTTQTLNGWLHKLYNGHFDSARSYFKLPHNIKHFHFVCLVGNGGKERRKQRRS